MIQLSVGMYLTFQDWLFQILVQNFSLFAVSLKLPRIKRQLSPEDYQRLMNETALTHLNANTSFSTPAPVLPPPSNAPETAAQDSGLKKLIL